MLAPPDDLPDGALASALGHSWAIAVTSLEYWAVGWGSQHWDVADAAGSRLFVTADQVPAGPDGPHPCEPHAGNTMLTPGGWVLIDWDTVLVAPRERDLWHLDRGDPADFDAYAGATGVSPVPSLLDLYRLRWDIADIASYACEFRRPTPEPPTMTSPGGSSTP